MWTMTSGRPIGVFDSGVGGLSVLAEVRSQLPGESVIYVADQRWAPYGSRSLVDVRDRSVQLTGQLIETGAKVVVVACNSASAAALHHLRAVYPHVPFIGMEPAVKPAAGRSRSGVIGVLATEATFQGELFATVVDRHSNGANVVRIVGHRLAELVEEGAADGTEAKALLAEYLEAPLRRGMDTLVLGCTHYAFLTPTIRSIVGDRVTLVDPAPAVARQVGRVVVAANLQAPSGRVPAVVHASTLDPARLAVQIERLIGEVPATAPIRW
jgi:glutamate racemase